MTVHDGNLDDKTWNHQVLARLKGELSAVEFDRLLYVADSALVTTPNLRKIAGIGLHFCPAYPTPSVPRLCFNSKPGAVVSGWRLVRSVPVNRPHRCWRSPMHGGFGH